MAPSEDTLASPAIHWEQAQSPPPPESMQLVELECWPMATEETDHHHHNHQPDVNSGLNPGLNLGMSLLRASPTSLLPPLPPLDNQDQIKQEAINQQHQTILMDPWPRGNYGHLIGAREASLLMPPPPSYSQHLAWKEDSDTWEHIDANTLKAPVDVLDEMMEDARGVGVGVGAPMDCQWVGCSASFGAQTELSAHLERCHVECRKGEDFVCLWRACPRKLRPFNARYKLLIHMRVHSGEKPNKCTIEGCPKAFSRLENLKIHIRSHTGERPYVCQYPFCPKAFSNSSDRAKHQRTHMETKPYVCQVPGCPKRYTDPSSLRKHAKNHVAKEEQKQLTLPPPETLSPTQLNSPTEPPSPDLGTPSSTASLIGDYFTYNDEIPVSVFRGLELDSSKCCWSDLPASYTLNLQHNELDSEITQQILELESSINTRNNSGSSFAFPYSGST